MIKLDNLKYEINIEPIENYVLSTIYKQLPVEYTKTVSYNVQDVAKWYSQNASIIKSLNAIVEVIENDIDFTIYKK